MRHLKIGGSTAARTIACPKWLTLSEKAPKPKSNAYADEGNLLHDAMELYYKEYTDFESMLGMTYNGIELVKAHISGLLVPAMFMVESVFDKYKIEEYTCEPFVQITENVSGGSIDMLAISEDEETILVLDYKFGAAKVDVTQNKQLLFYALAAKTDPTTRRFFAKCKRLVLAIIQPKISLEPMLYETDLSEVDAFKVELDNALDNLDRMQKGSHCQYCPAKPICPKHQIEIPDALKKLVDAQ